MKRRRETRPLQVTSQELLDGLLEFLRIKFYEGHAVTFAKDRPRLLQWVVLWPAKWLNRRGVTLPPDRYRAIFMSVFMDGIRFGQDAANITYLPAYLAKIIQSHFDHHEDEIYAEAKAIRHLVDNALTVAHNGRQPASDPVREMAAASRLLKPTKRQPKPATKSQLDLFATPLQSSTNCIKPS